MIRESLLKAPVSRLLRREAFRKQRAEVPFFEYRIDLYAYSSDDDRSVAVELKLTKWRRALQQALVYQLCADYVYIALPMESLQRIDSQLVKRHGVGIMGISSRGRCSIVIPAILGDIVQPYYRGSMLAQVVRETHA